MRLEPLVLAIFAASTACGGSSQKYASAAGAAAVAVAVAGINRAITGDCWAMCPQGSQCDKASGKCVPLPCQNTCPPDSHCATLGGQETCVPGGRDTAISPSEPLDAEQGTSEPAPSPPRTSDPCRGLCYPSEQCVSKGGVADCVPRASPPPAAP